MDMITQGIFAAIYPDAYPDTYPVKKPLPVIFVALPLALLILVASVAMLIRYVIFYLDRAFQ